MLGFFDSGIGGLEVMRAFRRRFPRLDMRYFGDRSHFPYGDRPGEEIRELTLRGVRRLEEAGATIVILACNTAAAHSIRFLQETSHGKDSGKRVLGVTVPGAEAVVERGWKRVGVLATRATVASGAYGERIRMLDPQAESFEIDASGLVELIEAEPMDRAAVEHHLERTLARFPGNLDGLVLGCTHYPIVQAEIAGTWERVHGSPIEILDPADEAARKFEDYLTRHPEFRLSEGGTEEIAWG